MIRRHDGLVHKSITSNNDTDVSSCEGKKAIPQSFVRVSRRMYLIPYKYLPQEVAISLTFGFQIILDAKLWKTIPRIRFSVYFWPQKKLTEIWLPPPPKKRKLHQCHNFVNFFWLSKVNGKSDSRDHFPILHWFSIYFWLPEKINEYGGFPKKKKKKGENYTNGAKSYPPPPTM